MTSKVKIMLFGNSIACREAEELLGQVAAFQSTEHEVCCIDDLEMLTTALVDWDPTLLIVTADGAEGMESVYRARERRPCIPVFWFSDDKDFGVLSYRLNCAYFSTRPVTAEKLSSAVQRCERLGISYKGGQP